MSDRYEKANKVTILSIFLNIILGSFKIFAGVVAHSTAMLADGVHSLSDVITSMGVLIGIFIAKKPKDKDHNYGHEKAETLAGFVLALVLLMVGLEIGFKAVESMMHLEKIKTPGYLALVAAAISIGVKEFQYHITMSVAKKYDLQLLVADAWHHRSDSISSVGALLGIIGSMMGYKFLDPLAGFVVALLILKVSLDVLKNTSNGLMDGSLSADKNQLLRKLILNHKEVKSIDQIRTRVHGSMAYADITIKVDENMSVKVAHDLTETIEKEVKKEIKEIADLLVHVEPN